MTSHRPEPRPALRKAADGATHPAMPRWEAPPTPPDASVPAPGSPSAFEITNPAAPTGGKPEKKGGGKKKAKGKDGSQNRGKAAGKTGGTASGKGGGGDRAEQRGTFEAGNAAGPVEMVKVTTHVPRSLRGQAKRKADAEGRTLEEAMAHLLQVWAGGGHH